MNVVHLCARSSVYHWYLFWNLQKKIVKYLRNVSMEGTHWGGKFQNLNYIECNIKSVLSRNSSLASVVGTPLALQASRGSIPGSGSWDPCMPHRTAKEKKHTHTRVRSTVWYPGIHRIKFGIVSFCSLFGLVLETPQAATFHFFMSSMFILKSGFRAFLWLSW